MEAAYRAELDDPRELARGLSLDHAPLVPHLAALGGRVLDVGGGMGLAARWLGDAVTAHVVVEPSTLWDDRRFGEVAALAGADVRRTRRLRGAGEKLPIRTRSMDSVIALWMLNHAADPGSVLSEAARVLRPGGRLFVVLEDMEPSWADLRRRRFPKGAPHARLAPVRKLWAALFGWPLQPDHRRIHEAELRRWLAPGFEHVARAWLGVYLTYAARRSGGPASVAGDRPEV